jgi:hypothetical protein
MAYSDPLFDRQGLQAADIFTSIWRAMACFKAGHTIAWIWPLSWLPTILFKVLWRYRGLQIVVALNKSIPELSWMMHLGGTSLEVFETDYRQAWEDTLAHEKNGSGEVVMVNIFVGRDSMSVPVLFNKVDSTKNSDAETFKQLLMWYCWMQYKGGFGEVLLPRRLVRVDKVQVGFASNPGFALSLVFKRHADMPDVNEQSSPRRPHQDLRLGSRYIFQSRQLPQSREP